MKRGSTQLDRRTKLYIQNEKRRRGQDAGSSFEIPGMLNECKNQFLKRIWSLPCPNKIKMFTWRVTHNSLAVRTNLRKRGVYLENCKCLFCSRVDEDGAHLFVRCKFF
jgi:hypothetical protein